MKKFLRITALLLVMTLGVFFATACSSNGGTDAETYTITKQDYTNGATLSVKQSATANGTFSDVEFGKSYAKGTIIKISVRNSSQSRIKASVKLGGNTVASAEIEGQTGFSGGGVESFDNVTLTANLTIVLEEIAEN